MANIMLCHDNSDYAETIGERWGRIHGHRVRVCTSARDSLQIINQGLSDTEIVIVHKDLGLGQENYDAGDVIRALDEYPYIRRGVVSGEFPYGETTVKKRVSCRFLFPNHNSF